ncbi:shikimate kinase [Bacillus chungangensis]|uniref:Shikimate kinase n=1 Tax=Bacillus chungangensis TaxID=587633 RepID=A0ABT9WPF7_9BACI|nr:shikimate kinase [Bacillus chungangensis]MDQ0175164.1 shikimate kinase [Bacillus chungangensis]
MLQVFLIGFMGAGKTTVGETLADAWNCPVYDTDACIVEAEQKTIPEIFAENGEAYFRSLEKNMLKKLVQQRGVITTGGGIILLEENRQLLKKSGRTFFLKCEPKVFLDRLKDDCTRPIIKEKTPEDIIDIYKKRLPFYEQSANIIIDTTSLTIQETVQTIEDITKRTC